MPYHMDFEVDGGCRGNGRPGSIGAAAAVHVKRSGKRDAWVRTLPRSPTPTNQRAEISAIILTMEIAIKIYNEMDLYTTIDLRIYSDSKYALGCMTEWIHKWIGNGWVNSAGNPVANQDLIKKALDLEKDLNFLGTVEYIWIPRKQNQTADQFCNQGLDRLEL